MGVTNIKLFTNMSDEELIQDYKDTWRMINVSDCYGTKDILWANLLENEIIKRGMRIMTEVNVVKYV